MFKSRDIFLTRDETKKKIKIVLPKSGRLGHPVCTTYRHRVVVLKFETQNRIRVIRSTLHADRYRSVPFLFLKFFIALFFITKCIKTFVQACETRTAALRRLLKSTRWYMTRVGWCDTTKNCGLQITNGGCAAARR